MYAHILLAAAANLRCVHKRPHRKAFVFLVFGPIENEITMLYVYPNPHHAPWRPAALCRMIASPYRTGSTAHAVRGSAETCKAAVDMFAPIFLSCRSYIKSPPTDSNPDGPYTCLGHKRRHVLSKPCPPRSVDAIRGERRDAHVKDHHTIHV